MASKASWCSGGSGASGSGSPSGTASETSTRPVTPCCTASSSSLPMTASTCSRGCTPANSGTGWPWTRPRATGTVWTWTACIIAPASPWLASASTETMRKRPSAATATDSTRSANSAVSGIEDDHRMTTAGTVTEPLTAAVKDSSVASTRRPSPPRVGPPPGTPPDGPPCAGVAGRAREDRSTAPRRAAALKGWEVMPAFSLIRRRRGSGPRRRDEVLGRGDQRGLPRALGDGEDDHLQRAHRRLPGQLGLARHQGGELLGRGQRAARLLHREGVGALQHPEDQAAA